MRSWTHSVVATLFVLVLLVAVPLVAVFGIPEFEPAVASSSSSSPAPLGRLQQDPGTGHSAANTVDDLFAPVSNPANTGPHTSDARREPAANGSSPNGASARGNPPAARSPRVRGPQSFGRSAFARTGSSAVQSRVRGPASERLSDSARALFAPHPQPRPARELAAVGTGHSAVRMPPAGRRTDDERDSLRAAAPFGRPAQRYERAADPQMADDGPRPLGWQAAVRRLNELGIRDFRLMPGTAPAEFHFSCALVPPGQTRVLRRFEAEAPEPLQAVQDVIDQVETWTRSR